MIMKVLATTTDIAIRQYKINSRNYTRNKMKQVFTKLTKHVFYYNRDNYIYRGKVPSKVR